LAEAARDRQVELPARDSWRLSPEDRPAQSSGQGEDGPQTGTRWVESPAAASSAEDQEGDPGRAAGRWARTEPGLDGGPLAESIADAIAAHSQETVLLDADRRPEVQHKDDLWGEYRSVEPDLFSLLNVLESPLNEDGAKDSEREAAIDRLVAIGPPALRWLTERFPGRLLLDRNDFEVDAMPPVEAHGWLLRALVRFGGASVPYVIPLLSKSSVDVRFYATLLFNVIPCTDAVPSLIPRLFDSDVRIRRVAQQALRNVQGRAEDAQIREHLLRELQGGHPARQRHAIESAAYFRTVESIPAIIDLLAHGDATTAGFAREALYTLTRRDFGESVRRWRSWWEKNRDYGRLAWLVDALGDRSESVRAAAFADLRDTTGQTFDFDPAASRRQRDASVKRWKSWLVDPSSA
jgi:hypothetical protein